MYSCHSALQGTASLTEPGGPGPELGPAMGGSRRNMSRAQASSSPLPPQTSVLGNESQKLVPSSNYDGLRMRLYRRCCYFRCVRKVKVPEVVTRYRCLSKVPSLVLHHLSFFRRLHSSDSRHLDTICVDVNRSDIKLQHPYASIGVPWACLTIGRVLR